LRKNFRFRGGCTTLALALGLAACVLNPTRAGAQTTPEPPKSSTAARPDLQGIPDSVLQRMSEPPGSPNRPKVGLVLSGGGARGATHVGVLKELERMRIPIDYIAGTSMGAIIGSLYASGMSVADIEKVLSTTDWDAVFSDRPPRKQIAFRRKMDDQRYIIGLQAGVSKKGIRVAQGLVTGQQLNVFLESLLMPVDGIEDFDKLPIPFRCLATDIVTGEEVVHAKGHLPTAVRTSMSLPGVFIPLEVNGRLLVDGGILNNLPVDVCRAMGADLIIAVDIGTPALDRDQLTSFVSITSQVTSILMQKNIDAQALKADILIRPDLKGYSNMNFRQIETLPPIGEQVVREHSEALGKLSTGEAEYAAWQSRARVSPALPEKIDFVRFEGTDAKTESLVRGKLETRPGQPLNPEDVTQDVDRVFNAGDYETVSYRLQREKAEAGLLVLARPNPLGPIYLRYGLLLYTNFANESNFAILAGLRWTRLNRLGAEWKTDMELGLNRRLTTEFYQPLDARARWFVAPIYEFKNVRQDIYVGEEARATYRATQGFLGLDMGLSLGQYGEIRIGPRWGTLTYDKITGAPVAPNVSATLAGLRGRVILDHLDDADFPTQGYYGDLSAFESLTTWGSDDSYHRAELKYRAYGTYKKNTFFGKISGGSSLGSTLPPFDQFFLGGVDSFAGYANGALMGRYYGVARLGYMRQVATLPAILGKGAYFFVFADAGNTWERTKDISASNLRYSASVALGASTMIGPMYIVYSYAKGGSSQLVLNIGKRF